MFVFGFGNGRKRIGYKLAVRLEQWKCHDRSGFCSGPWGGGKTIVVIIASMVIVVIIGIVRVIVIVIGMIIVRVVVIVLIIIMAILIVLVIVIRESARLSLPPETSKGQVLSGVTYCADLPSELSEHRNLGCGRLTKIVLVLQKSIQDQDHCCATGLHRTFQESCSTTTEKEV